MKTADRADVSGTDRLHYQPVELRDAQLLAYDEAGEGRIVEVFGDVATAEHIVIFVPGNDNGLGNYFDENRPTGPRASGWTLGRMLRTLGPNDRVVVIVWVGYRTPWGFLESFSRTLAERGAIDLARLTRILPRSAHVTLVGHSYGAVVCGLALPSARADDCVVLGSPGMGTSSREDLCFAGNLWAALGPSDWIRYFPRVKIGRLGHGPSPVRAQHGAIVFDTGAIRGHCGYFADASESLRNIARIGLARYDEITRPGELPPRLTASAIREDRSILGTRECR
ncbi:alpha/beta fold hydrolase [Rhodococcus erythropolis]|uniref:alpha/beta hydrolase n=1 Tax=Rhodococcus erythropolis TaxID=1833 RepID=UPI001E421156|nr:MULTISPECIES: alpha/beta hydrolase [Rhodococcus erythropolis group]MCD2103738.1 alpha/beta hydrolase family protein [Rhodococcus qingshengii]MCZ4522788.1 alpha/beta fold hydrolase [Rhodococcus erythropolis]